MYTWENAIITRKGLALLSKLTSGNTLHLTRAACGSGFVDPDILVNMNAMTNEKQSLTFATQSYPEEGTCAVPVRLTNTGLSEGYPATQVGIFAFDPDEDEILFLIAQARNEEGNQEEPKGTKIPSESEMPGYSAEWTFYIEYGQADDVTVVVDPSNTITEKAVKVMIDTHNNSSNPHPGVLATKSDLTSHTNSKNPHDGVLAAKADLNNHINSSNPHAGVLATKSDLTSHTNSSNPHAGVLAAKADLNNHINSSNPHAGVLATAASLNDHIINKNNPHGVTAKQLGLDKVNNTADSEKNVAFASEAAAARKVNYRLVVRVKGGNTEGTDMWTFDGSTSKSINITPENIGASEEGHTHTPEDIGLVPLEDIPNLYVWKKYQAAPSEQYLETAMESFVLVSSVFTSSSPYFSDLVECSDEINIVDGKVVLVSPTKVSAAPGNESNIAGKYAKSTSGAILLIPPDVKITKGTSTSGTTYIASPATVIGANTPIRYVAAKESDTYPLNGEHTDGFWYVYHKQLGE